MSDKYREEEGSSFSSNGKLYNINAIFAAVENDPVEIVSIKKLTWVLKHVKDIDEARVEKADVTIPILVTAYGANYLVVDGFHRLVKAQREGLTTLPYRYVTRKIMNSAEIKRVGVKKPIYADWL